MNTKVLLFYISCSIFPILLFAQRPVSENKFPVPKSQVDTLGKDSLKVSITKTVKISPDALDEPVDYQAKDSIIFENVNNLVHLYGDAMVKYQTIEVKAAYILLNIKESLATAEGRKDSLGIMAGFPDFKDKEQAFKSEKMRYNFKTKKGVVSEAHSKQQNLYVLGEKTKFVGKKDSTDNDIIYSKNAILTTCNHEHPHYGIRAQKLKVIANKLVIVGPSNLEIGGVPTPVWLPLGFYPVTNTQQTGLIFPNQYGYIPSLGGFGIQGIGWYFPINNHFDAKVTGTIVANGTFGLNLNTSYNYRYKRSGNLTIDYMSLARRVEVANPDGISSSEKTIRQNPISIRWSHAQDPKSRPNQTFNASLNISTNASVLQRNIQNQVRDVSNNNNNSNINYSKSFPGKPFMITAGLLHNQNISTHQLSLDPNINLQVNQLYPLKTFVRQGKDDFFNDILSNFNIQTGARALARVNTFDTILFKNETLNRMRVGASYNASAGMPFKILKYFQITPNINFSQNLHLDKVKKTYSDEVVTETIEEIKGGIIVPKTQIKSYGKVNDNRSWGFTPISTFNAGVSLNTNIYGTKQFRKGYFRGIRHQINLSGGFNYSPNLSDFSHCDEVQQERISLNDPVLLQRYSYLDGSVLGSPGCFGFKEPNYVRPRGTRTVNISTNHNLEIKVKNKRDSIAKKIKILQGLNLSTTINLNADSLKMTTFSPSISQNVLYNLINLNFTMTLTPYVQSRKNATSDWQDVNKYLWNEESLIQSNNFRIPKPVAFRRGNFNVTTGFGYNDIKTIIEKFKKNEKIDTALNKKPITKAESYKSITTLIESFRLNHTLSFGLDKGSRFNDTIFTVTNNLTLSGAIPLSKNWSINVSNIGYDFQAKLPTYSGIGIRRNLHCWEISGDWFPTRGTFLFTLRVIDAPLDFLKAPIQKQNADAFGGFRF